jgi:hypothetical protein
MELHAMYTAHGTSNYSKVLETTCTFSSPPAKLFRFLYPSNNSAANDLAFSSKLS